MNHPSEEIKQFIKQYEQCRLKAYLPTKADRPTIGYGMTFVNGKPVEMGDIITPQEAEELFDDAISSLSEEVNKLIGAVLTQSQYDAVLSLAFNIGLANLRHSTLLKLLNKGDKQAAADEFLRWNHQAGKVLPGLTFRRQEERELFLRKQASAIDI